MDKLSSVFLQEEIRRINDLNKRIHESSFIVEGSLDNETLMLINKDLRGILIQNNLPDAVINDFINTTIVKNFESGTFCDGARKVKCEHLS